MIARLVSALSAAARQIALGVLMLLLLSGSCAGELQRLAESDAQQRFMSFLVDTGCQVIDTSAFPGPVAHWLAVSWSGEILGTVAGERSGDTGDLAFLVEVSSEQIAERVQREFSREYGEGSVIRQRNLLIYRQSGVSDMPSFLPGGYPINNASIVALLRERARQKIDPRSPYNRLIEHTGFFRPFLRIYVVLRNLVFLLFAPAIWNLDWLRAFLRFPYTPWVVTILYVSTFFRPNRGRMA